MLVLVLVKYTKNMLVLVKVAHHRHNDAMCLDHIHSLWW